MRSSPCLWKSARIHCRFFPPARACGERRKSPPIKPATQPAPCAEELAIGPLGHPHQLSRQSLPANRRKSAKKSVLAFRGEIERALALGADYLVVHPGSYRGMTRIARSGNNWRPNPSSKPSPAFALAADAISYP